MRFGPVIDELIESLRVLPGVGQKTAQRMALDLLERKREGGMRLSNALAQAMERVKRCHTCRNLSEADICALCSDGRRDESILCVVESPSDLLAIEQSRQYPGKYFVLSGSLSPIDGRGPNQVGIPLLIEQVNVRPIKELILATNPTVEGEATAYYIADMARKYSINTSRIAHGVPVGGELEYVDQATLGHAFSGRKNF